MNGGSWTSDALNLSWVHPLLALGGRFPMEATAHLARALSIRCVVDLRIECCDDAAVLQEHGIELLHLPTHDTCAVAAEMLDQGTLWVGEKLAREHRVYIHCEHGIGRSALLAACVLVTRGTEPLHALSTLKKARWQVSPSPEQLSAFIGFCARQKPGLRGRWEVPSFDALAAIAYSHLRTQGG